jgi:hypothetical protein
MARHHQFTDVENRLILNAARGELSELAREIGVNYQSVLCHRRLLRKRAGLSDLPIRQYEENKKPRKELTIVQTGIFARPSFFKDEDLMALARGRK